MRSKGFTLVDLLTTISIFSVILLTGMPTLTHLVEKEKLGTSSRTVQQALALAREAAALGNMPVSICASMDGTVCEKKWGKQLVVFRDPSGNGQLAGADQVLQVLSLEAGWQVRWSAFGHKPQLTLNGLGYTQHQNGSFYLCPTTDKGLGRRIAVNKAGRGRIVPDETGSGYSQKSDGSDMGC